MDLPERLHWRVSNLRSVRLPELLNVKAASHSVLLAETGEKKPGKKNRGKKTGEKTGEKKPGKKKPASGGACPLALHFGGACPLALHSLGQALWWCLSIGFALLE